MRVLTVVGTLVRDTLHREDAPPLEDWGGIAFTLEALSAALPEGGWTLRPLLRVPTTHRQEVEARLAELPLPVDPSGLLPHDGPLPRVELRYRGARRVDERLLHLPPPLAARELAAAAGGADALLLNFITGFETSLEALQGLRAEWDGPLWLDVHSLLLARDEAGHRRPSLLPHAGAWLALADAVQSNQDEARRLQASGPPPPPATSPLLRVVTSGGTGASHASVPGFRPDPATWPALRRARRRALPGDDDGLPALRPSRPGAVPPVVDPDPTGCGDVWGAATFARLLAGDSLETAMDTAHRMASMNARRRGTAGLAAHLVSSTPEGP